MAPSIIVNTKVSCAQRLNLGATDGKSIPSAVVQTAVNVLSYNMNLTVAVQAPRVSVSLSPEKVVYEGQWTMCQSKVIVLSKTKACILITFYMQFCRLITVSVQKWMYYSKSSYSTRTWNTRNIQ